MSYIKHRDRIFLKKGRNTVRKRSDCNLRRISSCTDVRAWSAAADERRQYLLDSVSSNKASTSFGKYIPPDVIVDILKKQNSIHLKKLNSLKRCSSEDMLKKKGALIRTRSKVNVRFIKNENVCVENPKDDFELTNLRTMVKEMEGKLSFMKELEDENSKLKTLINVGIEKIENFEDIGPLVDKEYLSFPREEKCKKLSNAIDLMKNQCNKMKSNMEYLQTKNCKLMNKLKRSNSSERTLMNRQLSVSLETVDNAILKSKVSSKDVKIQRLLSLSEEQKTQIQSLVCHIKEMAIHFSWKEELLVGKLMEFKNLMKSNYEKAVQYEKRLSLCQDVIHEMGILRDHFKMVNTSLREESLYYKNRLRTVALKVLEMASKVECLLKELEKRDAKIKELSKFPGRSAMAVRLAQLDSILHNDFLFNQRGDSVVETFERLQRILKDLKNDAWDSYGFDHPLSFSDMSSQTSVEYEDNWVQTKINVGNICIQTDYPDEYVVKFMLYVIVITLFNTVVKRLKLYLKMEELTNRDLESQNYDLKRSVELKDVEIETLNNRNKILQDQVDTLNNRIYQENLNTVTALRNSENVHTAYESLNDLFNESLLVTAKEYSDYCCLLEGILEENDVKLYDLFGYVEIELVEQRWQNFRYLSELERKNDLLKESLSKEVHINSILCKEMDDMAIDLDQRDDLICKLKDLWMQAECEKTDLAENSFLRTGSADVSLQTEIEQADSNAMTDIEFTLISRQSFDKAEQAEIGESSTSCKFPKEHYRGYWLEDKTLRKKMSQINFKVKKIRVRIVNLRNKLELSVESLKKLKDSNIRLTDVNKSITSENQKLTDINMKLREVVSALRQDVASESIKNDKLHVDQTKFFNDFQRINLELMRLKDLSNKQLSENSINTDLTIIDIEHQLYSKDECIKQLKERIESLLDLLKEIEQEKKAKESNSVCQYAQCDFGSDMEERYQQKIINIRQNYDNIINNLKKEFADERDTKEKYYRNNLSLLKDTYERDIKRIKAANAESLRKIQTFHEDEIKAMKKSEEEAKTQGEQTDTSFVHEKHSHEIEQLRKNYENMLKEKSEMFLREKETLQDEMRDYMCEKERQVEEITARMEIGMKNMKKKCKLHMKKLQKENCFALEELRKQYDVGKIDEASSVDLSDMYSLSQDKDFSVVESEETQCTKDDSDAFVDVNTDTSGFDEDHYDCVMVDERRFLLRRIEQLEDRLAEKQSQSSENACDSEKRVWLERERCKEISRLLDKEMERNEKLRAMLKEEKARADNLTTANQDLVVKLHNLEIRHGKPVEPYSLSNKDPLSNFPYHEILGSYDSTTKSDLSACGPINYKYV